MREPTADPNRRKIAMPSLADLRAKVGYSAEVTSTLFGVAAHDLAPAEPVTSAEPDVVPPTNPPDLSPAA